MVCKKWKFVFQVSLLFAFLWAPSAWAGVYKFNASNYQDTDVWCKDCIETDANIEVVDGQFSIVGGNSTTVITINGLDIKRGQKWERMNISWSLNGGSGSVKVAIATKNGDALNGDGNEFTSEADSSIDLSGWANRTGASNLVVTITMVTNGGTASPLLSSMEAKFSGNNVILYPSPYSPSQGDATIKLDLDSKAIVSLSIYDSRGYLVKRIYDRKSFSAFDTPREGVRIKWNGKNANGTRVPSGIYTVVATVEKSGGEASSSRFRFLLVR